MLYLCFLRAPTRYLWFKFQVCESFTESFLPIVPNLSLRNQRASGSDLGKHIPVHAVRDVPGSLNVRVMLGPIPACISLIFKQILMVYSMLRAQSLTITSPWPEIEFLGMSGMLHVAPNAHCWGRNSRK